MGKDPPMALGSTAAAAPRSPHPATAHAHDAGSPSVAVVPPPAAHAPDAGAPSVAITPPPPAPDVAVATPSPPQAHPPFQAFAFAPDLRAPLPLQDAQGKLAILCCLFFGHRFCLCVHLVICFSWMQSNVMLTVKHLLTIAMMPNVFGVHG